MCVLCGFLVLFFRISVSFCMHFQGKVCTVCIVYRVSEELGLLMEFRIINSLRQKTKTLASIFFNNIPHPKSRCPVLRLSPPDRPSYPPGCPGTRGTPPSAAQVQQVVFIDVDRLHRQVPRWHAFRDAEVCTVPFPGPGDVPHRRGDFVASGGRYHRLDDVADGVHKDATIPPRDRNLLCAPLIWGNTSTGLHIVMHATAHCSWQSRFLSRKLAAANRGCHVQPDESSLPPVLADLVPEMAIFSCRLLDAWICRKVIVDFSCVVSAASSGRIPLATSNLGSYLVRAPNSRSGGHELGALTKSGKTLGVKSFYRNPKQKHNFRP